MIGAQEMGLQPAAEVQEEREGGYEGSGKNVSVLALMSAAPA